MTSEPPPVAPEQVREEVPPAPLPPSEHMLHPTSMLFGLAGIIRRLVVPLIFVVLFSRGRDAWVWIVLLSAFGGPAVLFELVRYLTTRLRFEGEEIIIRKGLIFRSQRHIPYHRIQNIDVVRNPFHRLAGVAIAKIETSSGSDTEAEFKVLSIAVIETMRERVFRRDSAPAVNEAPAYGNEEAPPTNEDESAASEPVELLRLRTRDLVQLGLITNRGIALMGVAVGILFERMETIEHFGAIARWLEQATESIGSSLPVTIALVLAVIIVLLLLSIVWSILRFHDFRLVRRGDDLRIDCGLLTRVGATIPRRRIQFITIRRTPLHRLFGKAGIRIETAGGNIKDDEVTLLSRRWFAPILPVERIDDILRGIDPDFVLGGEEWKPVHPEAPYRRTKLALITSVLIAPIAFIWLSWPIALTIAVVFVLLRALHARRLSATTRWTLTPGAVALSRGVVTRRTSITPRRCIQTAETASSPFDRRWRMNTFEVDTAGAGTAGHRIAFRDLPWVTAGRLRAALATRTA